MRMKNIETIRLENLRILSNELGGQVRLAERLNKSPSQVSQWLTGAKLPSGKSRAISSESAREIEKVLDLPNNWLDSPSDVVYETVIVESHLIIPQYDVSGAMGNGGLVLDDQPPGIIKSWQVDEQWVHMNVPSNTGLHNLCIVTGFGSSMQPMYNPGDPLLMDRGVVECRSDGVYFFRVGDHGYIKQLQRIPTTSGAIIRAKSMNPSYDPFDITDGMDFHILGKILLAWKGEKV